MLTSRRSFITGLVSLMAAPAIVRAGSLMPVVAMKQVPILLPPEAEVAAMFNARVSGAYRAMRAAMDRALYGDGLSAVEWKLCWAPVAHSPKIG